MYTIISHLDDYRVPSDCLFALDNDVFVVCGRLLLVICHRSHHYHHRCFWPSIIIIMGYDRICTCCSYF